MNEELMRIRRWLTRAQPTRPALVRALVTGYVGSLTGVALLVGATGLLVESARQPGLRAIAVVLVLIELFAFLRSPLRFVERVSAHRLGFDAVSTWRAWLVSTVGYLDYSRWRTYASGELLERALHDTDELQDLWLRFVVPLIDGLALMLSADVVVAFLPPVGHWWSVALELALIEALGLTTLVYLALGSLAYDRRLREARGRYRALLVELSAAAPELALLGRGDVVETRCAKAGADVATAEHRLRSRGRWSVATLLLSGLLALGAMASHPAAANTWLVVATVIAFSTADFLQGLRAALACAIEVSGGSSRLEALEYPRRARTSPWPETAELRLEHVRVIEDGRELLDDADAVIGVGTHVALVGESGVGKSSLLRVLASLDEPASGRVTIGGVALEVIVESELRGRLAYVASEPGLTNGFALDVLSLGRSGTRDPFADLGRLGLESSPATHFGELSRGERVRVALARAMTTSPWIYLLDEPTAGLGRGDTATVLELLSETGSTVIIATHDEQVIAWCDVVLEVREGTLVSR